jgi:uncharacterized protein with PIN domain
MVRSGKMTAQEVFILDACALIAFLQEEPGAEVVEDLLEEPGSRCIVHAINAIEVQYDLLLRGANEDANALEQLLAQIGVELEHSLSESLSGAVAGLKARIRRISLADCFALALAQKRDATLVTSDHREFDPIAEAGICRILFIR